MTLHRRPARRQQERTAAFVEQAAAEDTEQLHCLIPAGLHRPPTEPSEQGVHGLAGPDTIGIAADFPAAQVPQPVCRQVGTRQSAGRIEGPTAGCMLMGS